MDFVDYGDDEEELEKDYTALKSKENEEQIELRRLRTENRLLRQRIENLEKESASLADKLIQDQVTRAQEAEETYAIKNELSVTRQQLNETQKKLEEAEDIIGDIRRRTSIIQGAVRLDEEEEKNMVQHLQEELIAVRLREAETITHIKGLKTKIRELEDTNLRLQRAPSNDVQHLQEELIAVKLREAEANLSLKELRQKVKEIETYWEAHMERMATTSSPKEKNSKAEIRHLQEEVMTVKLREARAVADLKDTKQKVMELETQNQICQNQIRRMDEDNKGLKQKLEEAAERERDLKNNLKDLGRKVDDTESKRKEEAMMARIKDAENVQLIAELRQKISEIDIQREELLAAGQLHNKDDKDDLEDQLYDLRDEMIQLKIAASPRPSAGNVMTASFLTQHDSDEEWDTEVRDSENLDQTLSDIIEGKSPLTTSAKPYPRFNSLEGSVSESGAVSEDILSEISQQSESTVGVLSDSVGQKESDTSNLTDVVHQNGSNSTDLSQGGEQLNSLSTAPANNGSVGSSQGNADCASTITSTEREKSVFRGESNGDRDADPCAPVLGGSEDVQASNRCDENSNEHSSVSKVTTNGDCTVTTTVTTHTEN